MTNYLRNLSVAAASAVVGVAVVNAAPALAIGVTFSGQADSGDLAGANYNGVFSYDPSDLSSSGFGTFTAFVESLNLDLTFNTNTSSFTEADQVGGGLPIVETLDAAGNDLLGLDFAVEDAQLGTITFDFAFTPGFDNVGQASFTYDVENGAGGAGSVAFETVPEPLTMLGTGLAAGFGVLFRRVSVAKG